MFKKAQPFFLMCESSTHVGSGADLGLVDLPIQRERHTTYPKVESSGIKGSIRDCFERNKDLNKEDVNLLFGPESGGLHAGALGFTDARVLLFPVKSMKNVFAWVTCPQVLQRFSNDLKMAGIDLDIELPGESSIPANCGLLVKDSKIVLEEYTFAITNPGENNCTKLANWIAEKVVPPGLEFKHWREKIAKDIVVLSNDDFRDFVNLSTEVITRVKIDSKTGTVAPGALWTEEYLPADTIMYSLALASPIFGENKGSFAGKGNPEEYSVLDCFAKNLPPVMQIGGNATIGKGIVRTRVWEGI